MMYVDPEGRVVSRPKSIYLNGWTYTPPTDEQLAEAGYTPYVPPTPEPYVPTYAELVEQYIREHGYPTYGAELSVINNYADDPTAYLDAWQTYQGVRVEAKAWAEEQPHREEA